VKLWQPDNGPNLYLLALAPVAVILELDLAATAAALVAGLAWKWVTIQRRLAAGRAGGKRLSLETIAASPYVEKVRWCLDRLGLDYREEVSVGILGAIFLGRSVPRLRIGTGLGSSVIGDSPDILRLLWGQHSQEAAAAFLNPTPAAVTLEGRIDAYGNDARRWLYHRALPHREFTLRLWGRYDPTLPAWQRGLLSLCYPLVTGFLRRALGVSADKTRRSVEKLEIFLDEIEQRLADSPEGLLGDQRSYVDYAFAAHSCLWMPCPGYGGGRARDYLPPVDAWPRDIAQETEARRVRYPRVAAFVERLYASERG